MPNIYNKAVADVLSLPFRGDRGAAVLFLLEAIAASIGGVVSSSETAVNRSARGRAETADFTVLTDFTAVTIANLGPDAITIDTTAGGGTSFALPSGGTISWSAPGAKDIFNHAIPITIPVGTTVLISEVR